MWRGNKKSKSQTIIHKLGNWNNFLAVANLGLWSWLVLWKRQSNIEAHVPLIVLWNTYFVPGVARALWYVFIWRKELENFHDFEDFQVCHSIGFHLLQSFLLIDCASNLPQIVLSNTSHMTSERPCIQQTGLLPCLSEQCYILLRKNFSFTWRCHFIFPSKRFCRLTGCIVFPLRG